MSGGTFSREKAAARPGSGFFSFFLLFVFLPGERRIGRAGLGLALAAAVLWAYQNGIVTGMSDTTFAPINNVTREQMATILFRYTKTAAPDKAKASADLSGFADAGSVNDWAVDAMRWAVGQKLIAGITLEQSVYLQPRGNATRAQAATVLTRYYAQ